MKNYEEIENKRSSLDFDIDGIVYKINDFNYKKDLVMLLMHLDGPLHINFLLITEFQKLKILKFKSVEQEH